MAARDEPLRLELAHPVAKAAAQRYLRAIDAALPGLVIGFHLVGSAALGDFCPGASDLNFVTVLAAPLHEAALTALERLHEHLDDSRRDLTLDGIYALTHEFDSDPSGTAGPCVVDGRFSPSGRHERHAAAWAVLREFGIPMRGRSIDSRPRLGTRALEVSALARLVKLALPPTGRRPWETQRSRRGIPTLDASHRVLSACRDHYAVATGSPTSKEHAGLYALITFPDRWRPLIDEALRARRRPEAPSRYGDIEALRHEVRSFLGLVARDAHAFSNP